MAPEALEVFQLDLDDEILHHLGIAESVNVLWAEGLKADLIEDDFVEGVWEWVKEHIRAHGRPPTPSVLVDEFDLELDEPLTAVGDLLDRLAERFMRNKARSYMSRLGETYKADPAAVPEAMLQMGRELRAKIGSRGEAFGTGDFERAMARYDQSVLAGPGASFGWHELDHHFYGMRGITFFIAPPKTYKSWAGVNCLRHNLIERGQCVWLYSLELPAEETDMRLRCNAADVPFWRYLRHSIGPDERKRLKEASDYLDSCGIYRIVKPPIGERSIPELIERARDGGADLIIIDQLQYVETETHKMLGESETREYWRPLEKAREYSDDGPIVMMHQFNRTVMNSDRMPEMQQAKGSAAVEEVATLALGMWANKDMRQSNIIELGSIVNRNYQDKAWEIGVELTRGCRLDLLGEAVHDDE
jgi:hypothetical protein